MPAALPIPTGADPVPSNGNAELNVEPPPGIEGMPPLSTTAMSSFATAAKGVTTKQEAGESSNTDGLLVLNGA
jgi:poly(A) polymerase